MLDTTKGDCECRMKLGWRAKIAVVSTVQSGVMPDSLQGIEFWRIGEEIKYFHIVAVI